MNRPTHNATTDFSFLKQQVYTEEHLIKDIQTYLKLTDPEDYSFYEPDCYKMRTLFAICNRIANDFRLRPDSYFIDSNNVGKLDPAIKFRHAVKFLIVNRGLPVATTHLPKIQNILMLKRDRKEAREVLINYVEFMAGTGIQSEYGGQGSISTFTDKGDESQTDYSQWFTDDGEIKF